MRKTGNSSLQNPATRALVLIVLVMLASVYLGTSPVRRGFLYYTGIFAPSVVAPSASGLWPWSWKCFWLMLAACSALTILIQIFLYLLQYPLPPAAAQRAVPNSFSLQVGRAVTSFNYE